MMLCLERGGFIHAPCGATAKIRKIDQFARFQSTPVRGGLMELRP